jgi:putative flippase GtrA
MTRFNRLSPTSDQRALMAQLLRFGVSGGLMTALGVGFYAVAVNYLGFVPLFATLFAYGIAGIFGYVLHSRFSFRGHGRRDNVARTGSRFIVTMFLSYIINSLFVWGLTSGMSGEWWWPVPAMVFITPVIIFMVSRRWVFA